MSIPGNGTVNRIRFDFSPLVFTELVEEAPDTFFEDGVTRNTAVKVDGVLEFTVGNVVAGTAGRVILVGVADIDSHQVFGLGVLPCVFVGHEECVLLRLGFVGFLWDVLTVYFGVVFDSFLDDFDAPLAFGFGALY
jgi:hypothetical protein